MATSVLQISDTHLSQTHAYFTDNFEACFEAIDEIQPDFIVHTGDACFNAPDNVADLSFAANQCARFGTRWHAIPGNHDVGEAGDNPRLGQPVTTEGIEQWRKAFGPDSFVEDIEAWRLIGINSELLGSGLKEEEEQWAMLENAVSTAEERQLGLFLHKPLFSMNADTDGPSGSHLHPQVRATLLAHFDGHPLRFVSSGHLHAYAQFQWREIKFVWAPTTAFVDPARESAYGAVNRAGLIHWKFDGSNVSHSFIEPALLQNIDITNWSRTRGTSIRMPPRSLRPPASMD